MITRVFLAILTGLVAAVVLHIGIVLAIPQFATNDAYSKLQRLGEPGRFFALANETNATGFYNQDPYLRAAVCWFDVGAAPTRILASGNVPFWSVAVFDRQSNEVFSMNDRTAVIGGLDLTLVNPNDRIALRKSAPDELIDTILVGMQVTAGYAVLRTLAPSASYEQAARSFLSEADCSRFELF